MKIFKLSKNVLNIQKCSLPDCDYLERNYGSYCVIRDPGSVFGVLVKIGLNEPKQISGVLIDYSVIIFQSSCRAKPVQLKDADYRNFKILPPPSRAIIVNVRIVFGDVTSLIRHKHRSNHLQYITKEILKLYTFSLNSVIFLDNLPECKRFGLYCIDIVDVSGECKVQDVNIYKCTEGTVVNISESIRKEKYEVCYFRKDEIKLGGLNQFYEVLKEIIQFSKNVPGTPHKIKLVNKILVSGPAGCGKTSLIQTVVRDCKTALIEVSFSEICYSFHGEIEWKLQHVFDEAMHHINNQENCVILIEDIDVFCGKRGETSSNLSRCVNKLVSLLEIFESFYGIVIIGTATDLEDIDPQLRTAKCFDDELVIMPPTEEDRKEIIYNILKYFKVECSEIVIEKFALWTPGFVGSDLYLAIQDCILLYHNIKGDLHELNSHLLESCFMKVLSNITPTSLKGSVDLLVSKTIDFSKIGGLNDIKKILDISVKQQLVNPEMFMRLGIPLTKGILLYGPPGCAKTTLVKALAKESNMTFLSVSSADLYSPYVGDPEKKIVQLFSQARIGAPAIIFIDEIDGLVGSKVGDRMRGVQERVLSTLLVEMDGVSVRAVTHKDSSLQLSTQSSSEEYRKLRYKSEGNEIIVIGATNRPERLDDALKRPGRFDKIIYVSPPDENERLNILKKITETMPLEDTVDLESLAGITENYSGADLKNLCYESAIFALTESGMSASYVSSAHFQQVLARTRPSLNSEMIRFYESFRRNIH